MMMKIPAQRGWLNVLRLGLLVSAIGWGVSFWFVVVPWEAATDQLRAMGAQPIRYQPLLDYWFKMAAATFGCIGLASLLACLRPHRYEAMIRLIPGCHAFLAIVLIGAATANGFTLRDQPTFLPDLTFCGLVAILTGVPLWKGSKEASGGLK